MLTSIILSLSIIDDYSKNEIEDIIRNMSAAGADTFIEIGPGKTLCGFVKRTLKGVTNVNVEDTSSLEKALEKLNAAV